MLNYFNIRRFSRYFCDKYPRLNSICRSKPLIYDKSDVPVSDESVLVLSPNDYWVVAAELNVKTSKEASLYGAALFDLDERYRYTAQKVGENSYVLIAYDPHHIAQIIQSNPNYARIKKVTFSQWVFAEESHPIALPNGKYLSMMDGIVVEIDGAYVRPDTSISLSEAISSPKLFLKTLPIEEFTPSELSPKTLKITLLIGVIFFGNLMAIAFNNYHESRRLSDEMQSLLDSSNLPATSIEREAIFASLKAKEAKQLHFRHVCREISELSIDVKHPSPSAVPVSTPIPSISSEGIVLIPGSKPGEANRLLVDNNVSAPVVSMGAIGMRELNYDSNAINLVIDTQNSEAKEALKRDISKKFKQSHISEHETQLEVRLK